jgi:hypothetical protein
MYLFVDYLGGLSTYPDPLLRGALTLEADGVRIETRTRSLVIATDEIDEIEVLTEHAARGRAGVGRLFGVLGAATAKGAHDRSTLLLHARPDETACIRVPGWSEHGLLDHVAAWLASTGIAIRPPTAESQGPTISVADELRKLADLRDGGLLSDAEFATQRDKLLG